jgi:hypothetical protein
MKLLISTLAGVSIAAIMVSDAVSRHRHAVADMAITSEASIPLTPVFRDGSDPAYTIDDLRAVYGEDAGTILAPKHNRAIGGTIRVGPRPHGYSTSLSALTPTLAAKVAEINKTCGSKTISGYRPGAVVAGSGHPSLHSAYPSKAADLQGNPSCIYGQLRGWKGGYSTDYNRVRHVHMSYSPPGSGYLGGREWHARFRHWSPAYGHHRKHTRIARG